MKDFRVGGLRLHCVALRPSLRLHFAALRPRLGTKEKWLALSAVPTKGGGEAERHDKNKVQDVSFACGVLNMTDNNHGPV